ncbi:COG1470 family protein [Tenacibaculum ovolyticum]|uniref:COG1470 family protein n=1 Tax=Tenacibaculum ovolyticum TaxID=104270 RepID=UPI00040CB9BE|nr:hypothetical protein [Tenacibaculum ovolyticum]
MDKITFLLFVFTYTLFVNAQQPNFVEAKNCSAKLKVIKNRNVKSISPNSTLKYYLILTNNTDIKSTYKIGVRELKESCSSNDVLKENVSLNFSLELKEDPLVSILNKEITLNPNQSYRFKVEVKALENAPVERWNCSQVEVISLTCNKLVTSTMLKTFVRNPNLR